MFISRINKPVGHGYYVIFAVRQCLTLENRIVCHTIVRKTLGPELLVSIVNSCLNDAGGQSITIIRKFFANVRD